MMADKQHPLEPLDRLSRAEREPIVEADHWLKHNQPIPHQEVLAEFGLTIADWKEMGQDPPPEQTPSGIG